MKTKDEWKDSIQKLELVTLWSALMHDWGLVVCLVVIVRITLPAFPERLWVINFVWDLRWGRKCALGLLSRPLEWKAGVLLTESSTRLSDRIYWLGNRRRTSWRLLRTLRGPLGQAPYICYECLRWKKDVDYLPMAKPVCQLTTRGSAVTVRAFQALPVAGSPHRRPRSLSFEDREKCAWTLWDRDTRWFGRWPLDLLVRLRAEGGLVVAALLTSVDWKWFLSRLMMNSSRGKVPARARILWRWDGCLRASVSDSSYLVDPASSHMLVSKIKPCMSKYKQICTVKLRMAH